MNENTYHVLMPILKDFFLVAGTALFLLSLVVGLLLIFNPSIIVRYNRQTGKRFSLRQATKFLEVPNTIDSLFYRHHRIIGAIVTLTSAYMLYYFLLVYDAALIAEYMTGSAYATVLDLLISTFRLFMLFSCVFILLIGIVIFIRPSRLKTVEAWANRWISTRQASQKLSVEHDEVNLLVDKYPRITGLIIVFLSLYTLLVLFMVYTA